MSTIEVGSRDQRVAAAVMLGAAAASPLWASSFGVPCGLRSLTGIPCPLCGLTRSVCATVTGHVGDALALNPFGVVAVVVAIALVVTWRRGPTLRVPGWLPFAGLAVSWLWQIARIV
jgi:hypothetical protein